MNEMKKKCHQMVEVKVLMALAEENNAVSKEGVRNVAVTDSSATHFDSADESSVCSIPLPPLKKLDCIEPISGPKTIKLILRSKSTFKAVPQLLLRLCGSYDHDTNGHNMIISLEKKINPRNPQHAFKKCEACGSSNHTITDHYDIEWFKRGEALQAKKAKALKSTRAESSNDNRSKTPTKSLHPPKFDEKDDDGYLLGYSLVSKAFRIFNTRRQQTEETYHITFDESHKAIKFSKPSVENINIAGSERYPPDEYLYLF
nr:retrovirus-related Pol polyprotein from transposon TNT 1-94 [Tanacetum cinerariifolium]